MFFATQLRIIHDESDSLIDGLVFVFCFSTVSPGPPERGHLEPDWRLDSGLNVSLFTKPNDVIVINIYSKRCVVRGHWRLRMFRSRRSFSPSENRKCLNSYRSFGECGSVTVRSQSASAWLLGHSLMTRVVRYVSSPCEVWPGVGNLNS